MNRRIKFGVVLAGYAVALLAAWAAVAIRQAQTSGPDAQAAAGMYAFGDFILFVGVFGAVAIFPTVLALYFLRSCEKFWNGLSIAAMTSAVTGPVAATLTALAPAPPVRQFGWALAMAFGFLRMLCAPLLAVAGLIAGLLAPTRRSCWLLLGAALIEGMVCAYAIFHWLHVRR